MKKCPVINLFGGPGAGKSTCAALMFAYLKNKNCNVELVREYAKDVIYKGSEHELVNQIYITAKQYKRLRDVATYGVDLIITDSPLLLGKFYCDNHHNEFNALLYKINDEFDNKNVFIHRVKPYNQSGRTQTENESNEIAENIRKLIMFDYIIDGNKESQITLAESIYQKYIQKNEARTSI